jgi:uncharacterized membrane protein YcaP (DUF421 family)
MDKQDIVFGDWKRLLLGAAPATFLLEVLLRSIVVYVILLFAVRLLGKRMSGQLTITELAVILTLGGIVALAMQTPDRGVLQGLLVLLCALAFQRGITLLDWKNAKIEQITQGRASVLAKDGMLELEELKTARITREQLFSELRNRGIFNLGAVKRVYLEGCGEFSVFRRSPAVPGLSLLPADDQAGRAAQHAEDRSERVCSRCGCPKRDGANESRCPRCGSDVWDVPVEAEGLLV